jgi:quaternary ammonium compound-resistance protein SugE
MAWIYLLVAGVFEIGWPLGMKLGWTPQGVRALPLVLSVVSMALSGVFLFLAQQTIPMGTAYAVWTGIGAIGAFVVGLVLFKEPAVAVRFVCVGLIAAGVIGLKVFEPAGAA